MGPRWRRKPRRRVPVLRWRGAGSALRRRRRGRRWARRARVGGGSAAGRCSPSTSWACPAAVRGLRARRPRPALGGGPGPRSFRRGAGGAGRVRSLSGSGAVTNSGAGQFSLRRALRAGPRGPTTPVLALRPRCPEGAGSGAGPGKAVPGEPAGGTAVRGALGGRSAGLPRGAVSAPASPPLGEGRCWSPRPGAAGHSRGQELLLLRSRSEPLLGVRPGPGLEYGSSSLPVYLPKRNANN